MKSSPVQYDAAAIVRRPVSLGQMFFERVEATPDAVAFTYPVDDTWHASTWAQTGDLVEELAAGLIHLGIRPEERVAIASETRFEWILADLAIVCAGAATTTVYPSTMSSDVAHILTDSGSRLVFAENAEQVAKLRENRAVLKDVVRVILIDGEDPDNWVVTMEEVLAIGRRLLKRDPYMVIERVRDTRATDLATLMYTSGTTGKPKGVRLKHSSWTYEGAAIASQGILGPDDVQYLWLPLSHSFGKVLLSTQLACGFTTAVDGRVDKIIDNLAVVQPTFMGAAPRIFEKAHARILAMQEQEGGFKKKIFDQAFAVAKRVHAYEAEGKNVPFLLRRRYKALDKLVFAKIRARFGGNLRFFISGAAALNPDIAKFFDTAGILILEGYGLTESSAGTFVNHPDHYKVGTVGTPFPLTEVSIAEDGEILIKGPGVMEGYHNLPDETASVLKWGWLHTGDIGEIDEDGFLKITDRKKDFFKTSQGKYVAPTAIEGAFKAVCRYVSHFVVVGNDKPFCTAIVALDPESVAGWAEHKKLPYTTYEEIVASPEAHAMVEECVEQLNEGLNRWEQIKKFVISDHDLTVESGELTPSMKVKRKDVYANFADQIADMYPHEDYTLPDLTDAELELEAKIS